MKMGKPGLLFDGFISYLRRQGFIIGIDHHLRLQKLLNRLGSDCEPADLKYLLCPIFAASEKQQQQFYRAFDNYFKPLEASAMPKKKSQAVKPGKKETAAFPEAVVTPAKWPYILVGFLLVILIIVFIFLLGEGTWVKIESQKTNSETTDGGGQNISGVNKSKANGTQPGLMIWIPGGQQKLQYVFREYRYIFRWVGLLAPFIIFLLVEGYKYNQRRLILVKQRGKKPPFMWSIKVETPGTGFMKNDRFYEAAQFLRKRMESDITSLDIEKTISATIENAGFPAFRYKLMTRPPEYLILIDLPGYRDHYSHLCNTMVAALENDGLYVVRYFYEHDPRVCFKEIEGQREYLFDLKNRYKDHRLIICGFGDELLDPLTGEMSRWTSLLQTWQERALLTTRPPQEWGRKEITLAREFTLVPATLEGLCTLKDHWEIPKEPAEKNWKDENTAIPHLNPGREEELVENLWGYLGSDTFQWLCACAVYPELHWDLTLYLGMLPCMPENLVREENMLRLLRLPWFRTGIMPDELRWVLISRLDIVKSRATRNAIVDLMEENKPPTGSFAYESYRLHLAVQRWLLSPADQQKQKAGLKNSKNTSEKSIVQDYTLLRFLETAPGMPLHFVLPKRLRKLFYGNSVPWFDFNTSVRMVMTIFIAINLFLFFNETNLSLDKILNAAFLDFGVLYAVALLLFFKHCLRDILMDKIPIVLPEKTPTIPPDVRSTTDMWLNAQLEVNMSPKVRLAGEKAKRVHKNEKGFWEADYGNDIIMVYIPSGKFTMGSNDYYEESPSHEVYLDGYWIGKYEVTLAQYEQYCEMTGKKKPDDRGWSMKKNPVIYVSWDEATAYCEWLSGKTGLKFKLPNEAQWEKAARGTDSRKYPWGNRKPYRELVNFNYNIGKTTPVGSYPEGVSPYGLMDMAGNVWEWCSDWYGFGYYKSSPQRNPIGPDSGSNRVIRGGDWSDNARILRCTNRGYIDSSGRSMFVGFRLCLDIN